MRLFLSSPIPATVKVLFSMAGIQSGHIVEVSSSEAPSRRIHHSERSQCALAAARFHRIQPEKDRNDVSRALASFRHQRPSGVHVLSAFFLPPAQRCAPFPNSESTNNEIPLA